MKEKSYAKANIFLKIVGKSGNLHKIASRFILLKDYYDEISFVKKQISSKHFVLKGNFNCSTKDNIIYKAYQHLVKINPSIESFFCDHEVQVVKNIPCGAGLGGGSSNGATFLKMINSYLNLNFEINFLNEVAQKLGSDVSFFLYDYEYANIHDKGQIVEYFDDYVPKLEFKFLNIHCDTKKVYENFSKNYYHLIDEEIAQKMLSSRTSSLLLAYENDELNDLFLPAVNLYPSLKPYFDEKWFLSGSGSSIFRIVNEDS